MKTTFRLAIFSFLAAPLMGHALDLTPSGNTEGLTHRELNVLTAVNALDARKMFFEGADNFAKEMFNISATPSRFTVEQLADAYTKNPRALMSSLEYTVQARGATDIEHTAIRPVLVSGTVKGLAAAGSSRVILPQVKDKSGLLPIFVFHINQPILEYLNGAKKGEEFVLIGELKKADEQKHIIVDDCQPVSLYLQQQPVYFARFMIQKATSNKLFRPFEPFGKELTYALLLSQNLPKEGELACDVPGKQNADGTYSLTFEQVGKCTKWYLDWAKSPEGQEFEKKCRAEA